MTSPRSKRRSSMRRSLLETLAAASSSSMAVEEPTAKKMKVDLIGESLELPNSGIYINEKVDKLIVEELQVELDGWTKLLHEARNSEDNRSDFLEVVTSCSIPTKHHLRNQQVDELEAKFSTSLEVINAFMERVHIVNAKHAQNIQSISRRLYENRLEKYPSADPKTLINQILELHRQHDR